MVAALPVQGVSSGPARHGENLIFSAVTLIYLGLHPQQRLQRRGGPKAVRTTLRSDHGGSRKKSAAPWKLGAADRMRIGGESGRIQDSPRFPRFSEDSLEIP